MAGEAIQALISAGPFLGIDNTQTDIYVSPTKGFSMTAGDCEIIPKSLVAKAGRTNLFQAPDLGKSFAYIAQADDTRPVLLISQPISAWVGGTAIAFEWDPVLGRQQLNAGANTAPGGSPFTEAIGIPKPNNGAGAAQFATNFGTMVQAVNGGFTFFTYLQHSKPPAISNVTYTVLPAGGSVGAGTYVYAYTYVDSITGEETTPTFDTTGTVVAGASSVTLNSINSYFFAGSYTNDGGADLFQTNLYRSSLAQPTFFLVNRITNASNYVDIDSDATISSRQQLTFNRDVPPVKMWGDFSPQGNVAPNSGNNGETLYFPGAPMWEHQGRMFFFPLIINADTGSQPQLQLWYSNIFRYWEYDKINNVFLVDLALPYPVTAPFFPPAAPVAANVPYIYPNNLFFEMPSAGVSLASVSLFWTTKSTYMLYGNSQATYVFQKFADTGCLSTASVAKATIENAIGVFWMSENGVYFTTGGTIQYISEDIRSVIDGLSISDRYNCVGFYSNHTYYISFPGANQTWGYRTSTNQWHGPLPYSVLDAVSSPSDPILTASSASPGPLYSVATIRNVTPGVQLASVDAMFTQTDTDLGIGQQVTYISNDQPAGNPHIQKEYTHIAITHKVQATAIPLTVKITTDDDPTKVGTATFDLSKGPTQITTISYAGAGTGTLQGYVAKLQIQFTTVPENATAPIQVKNVTVYGKMGQRMLTPTQGMS